MKSMQKRFLLPFLFLLLIGLGFCGLILGSARFSFEEVRAALGSGGDPMIRLIVLQLRLPRVVGAMLAGCGLAVSGLLLQSATGNHRRQFGGGAGGYGHALPVSDGLCGTAAGGVCRGAGDNFAGAGNFGQCRRTPVPFYGAVGGSGCQFAVQCRHFLSVAAVSGCAGFLFGVFGRRLLRGKAGGSDAAVADHPGRCGSSLDLSTPAEFALPGG